MALRPETEASLSAIEKHAGRTFRHRAAIGTLVEMGSTAPQALDDLLFTAKFITNASAVLRRVGTAAEESAKLSAEFTAAIERGAAALRVLLTGAPKEIARNFHAEFLDLTASSMGNLLSLFTELSWVKNYFLDQKTGRS